MAGIHDLNAKLARIYEAPRVCVQRPLYIFVSRGSEAATEQIATFACTKQREAGVAIAQPFHPDSSAVAERHPCELPFCVETKGYHVEYAPSEHTLHFDEITIPFEQEAV